MNKRGMLGERQTADQRKTSTDTAPPRRVSTGCTPGGSPSPIEGTDSAAELPSRDAIPVGGDRDEAGRVMTGASERPVGSTRHRLIAAASRLFAHRPYSMVSLDDILTEAGSAPSPPLAEAEDTRLKVLNAAIDPFTQSGTRSRGLD
jgi:hypothetical protein